MNEQRHGDLVMSVSVSMTLISVSIMLIGMPMAVFVIFAVPVALVIMPAIAVAVVVWLALVSSRTGRLFIASGNPAVMMFLGRPESETHTICGERGPPVWFCSNLNLLSGCSRIEADGQPAIGFAGKQEPVVQAVVAA